MVETVGRRLADLKDDFGWPSEKKNKLPTLDTIDAYEAALRDIRIVDPACGSGAFLITTLAYLLDEWKALRHLRRQLGQKMAEEDWTDAAVREILRRNLYGVDINPASVEITKLALWLHTARSDKPLSSLDNHICDGNSLIGPDFYTGLAPYSEDEKERINAFDWQATFPGVFERGGFDAVVGNPPYVKFQNFRKVHADMAAFLKRDPKDGGVYHSTQTGNFDLYLPFIEKGIQLLNDNGRLGYIAPSVWQMTDYGAGLRGVIERGRHLWGWIDFGSHQVFDDATVYTALMFFSKRLNNEVAVVRAPNGVVAESPWEAENIRLPYDRLTFGDRWLLVTGAERDLIDKLTGNGARLDDPSVSAGIHQGLITSADHIYHLKRLGPNRYEEKPPKGAKRGRVVEIEDEIMRPLVSGTEASRYLTPQTDTYLLFPYCLSGNRPSLIPASTMRSQYPNVWAYLTGHEEELRAREDGKFDIDAWYQFGRSQNLGKQEQPKLMVAQTVNRMQVSADSEGAFYINNVRVNGIMPACGVSLWATLAALNAKPCDFYFRKTAKPKDNGYFEANKQFIKYLPIPVAEGDDSAALASDAERLQELRDQLRQALDDIAHRMESVRIRPRPDEWLFSDLPDLDELKDAAPKRLIGTDRRKWAKKSLDRKLEARHAALEEHLKPGVPLSAELERGELRFLIDGIPSITGIFPAPEQAPFIVAQWKVLASRTEVTARITGKKLATELKKVSLSADDHIVADVIRLQEKIATTEAEIAVLEDRINRTIYRLHDLTPDEIAMIEATVQ